MNAHLQAALVAIWTEYAADVTRRGGILSDAFAREARQRAHHYRDGACLCGKPVDAHFDEQNRKLSCEQVTA